MGFVDFFKTFKKDNQERATPKEAPSHWIKCPSCNALMYYKEVIAQYHTCPKCNFHMRIGLKDRISLICDEGSFVEFDKELAPTDPLNFVDKKSYKKRIEEYEKNADAQALLSAENAQSMAFLHKLSCLILTSWEVLWLLWREKKLQELSIGLLPTNKGLLSSVQAGELECKNPPIR